MSALDLVEKRKVERDAPMGCPKERSTSGKLGVLAPPQAGQGTLRRCRWTALLFVMFKEADAKA